MTFGIEEEFFLVDRMSLEPASVAPEMLNRLASESTAAGRVTGEFLASQIEWSTQVFTEMESAVTLDADHYGRRVHHLVGIGATTDVATVAWYATSYQYGVRRTFIGGHGHQRLPGGDRGVAAPDRLPQHQHCRACAAQRTGAASPLPCLMGEQVKR